MPAGVYREHHYGQQGSTGNNLVCQQGPIGSILVGQGSKCNILVGQHGSIRSILAWASRVQKVASLWDSRGQ